MTHKNWDNLRDNRIYGYLNQKELDVFLEAMRIRDISQQATAVRTFIFEHSQQIILNNQSKQTYLQIQTVKYRL